MAIISATVLTSMGGEGMVSKSSQRAGVKRSWPRNKKPVSKIFGLDIRTMAPLEIGGREGFRTGFQVFTKFYFNNVFVSVGVCAYECSFHRGQKRMLDHLLTVITGNWELHADDEKQGLVLYKRSLWFKLLSCLSSPSFY